MSYFIDTAVNIVGNTKLRTPQIEAYIKIQDYFAKNEKGEALVVLPTGTGKSGLISIAPFGVSKGRVLIVTPGLVTKQSIRKTQEALEDNFWVNFDVIFNPDDLPVVSEYRADISNEHLEESHIVYSNIHMLTEARARGLLRRVGRDFFDMIIIDEAHHAPADSWLEVLAYFGSAKKLHVTGTPFRGDNQEVPGEKIHETPLSEVMRDRYVKLLRKETVNAHELYFTVPELPGKKLSKEDVLALKEREWLEKSVALSESCSKDVIQHSVRKLKQFKEASPKVPHKILAIGCSIRHAEDLHEWYKEHGLESVIVHSEMEADELEASFRAIDTHQCQVVISVNMLMEGYDHQYLSTLAIFRPYRSINAFAQVVGRVLRAIPSNEITDFEIDNNAVVIYHEEIGLNLMWKSFQKEVDRAKNQRVREYSISDAEYASRDKSLAGVDSDVAFVSDQDSYLEDVDFNALFERARAQVLSNAAAKIEKIKQDLDLDEAGLEDLKKKLIELETRKVAKDIDPNLIAKRPDQARRKMKDILAKKAQDEVASLLSDLEIDAKATNLARQFSRYLFNLQANTPNDGVLVRYVNSKLHNRFGAVKDRDNARLLQSIDAIGGIIEELRKMLSKN
ncbi:DEAD/DEAH box helicase [Myxococcus sp. 1LA]